MIGLYAINIFDLSVHPAILAAAALVRQQVLRYLLLVQRQVLGDEDLAGAVRLVVVDGRVAAGAGAAAVVAGGCAVAGVVHGQEVFHGDVGILRIERVLSG